MKDGITKMLEPHNLPGSGGVITLALLELAIERHLRVCSTEKSARDLFEGVLKKVREGNTGGGMTADQLPAVLPSGALTPAAPAETYIVPALVAASGHEAIDRFLNFFATQIENDNTREAYLRAAREFLTWCDGQKIGLLTNIQPVHVAAWIKQLKLTHSVPTVKLRLAAIRHLFD
jgi:hypothetical protein